MFSSRSNASLLTSREAQQFHLKVFCRFANSASKHHEHKPKHRHRRSLKDIEQRYKDHHFRSETALFTRLDHMHVRDARRRRREDWDLGPLKPWREAVVATSRTDGVFGAANPEYGTIHSRVVDRIPEVPEHRRIKHWFFRIGDRVCLVEGRDGERGKIGTIKSINYKTESVTVEGINKFQVRVLPQMKAPDSDDDMVRVVNMPVSFRSLRIVYPLPDPVTGEYRDCILNHLEKRNVRRNPFRGFDVEDQQTFDRYLMPQNIKIPWPEEEEDLGRDLKSDTVRAHVEEGSFMPTLLRPPAPEGLLSELRKDDTMFNGFMKDFDIGYRNKKVEEQERQIALRQKKDEMKLRGARNIARGKKWNQPTYGFMTSTELPRFTPETTEIIAQHMLAARERKFHNREASAASSSVGSKSERSRETA